ncbi:rod shape-determining protein MreC [Parasphingopyxis algicola]|uniref:rod shape-determining protein MreC n=1 Tax=Parasphingopyxis algicola TaxID=2026624 RepID=UPI0015A1327C|nr:rod shape-determining protein MreC [Parasphingopyxis algicola]QLC23842.1 rod shape-determining protein MreC [Parasphingopyxis algicola]
MASNGSKRPGFSRRARFGLFAGYVVAITGALVGAGLVLIAIFDPQGFSAIRGGVSDVTAPISSTGRGAVQSGGRIDDYVGNWWNAGRQNAELRAELETARRELIEARATEQENRRLRELLNLIEGETETLATARLVNSSLTSARRMATLFAGRNQGVMSGQPVRAADGLVGRILDSGRHASRVLLLTDRSNIVPVRLTRDGTPAFTTGRGDGTLEVRSLEAGRNPFEQGDILVTSGTGGIYPPGVPVAVISEVFGDSALATPLANPASLDFAIVQPAYEPPVEETETPEEDETAGTGAGPGFSETP